MVVLHSPRALLLFSSVLGAQCGYVVPVFSSIEGDQGYSYPNLVTGVSDNSMTISSKAENASILSKYEKLNKQDRSQAASGDYWLGNPDLHHFSKMPWSGSTDYQVFRDVTTFGAKGDGIADDTDAINRAISQMSLTNQALRCGWLTKCGSTTTQGALVYFPRGKYLIKKPIIHYYYTQLVGDAITKPTIVASPDFGLSDLSAVLAMIESNPYVPGEGGPPPNYPGQNWYIPQNQFFRQIRNLNLDMTAMPSRKFSNDLTDSGPIGIHWQIAQATSLQNIKITMPEGNDVSHVGIDTENGSGGFVCDVDVLNGHIGWRVGSQQFTARHMTFVQNNIAVWMGWDWGFVWKSIGIIATKVGIKMINYNGGNKQGIGSVSLIDSQLVNVEDAGMVLKQGNPTAGIPNIVIENLKIMTLKVDKPGKKDAGKNMSIVRYEGVDPPILPKMFQVDTWAMGNQVMDRTGTVIKSEGNFMSPATRVPEVLKAPNGHVFERSKPQYEAANKILQITSLGVKNDGTGDQSALINQLLDIYKGSVVYFPAGVYAVADTIYVPPGTKMVGEGWSQIMGYGSKFSNETNPWPIVKVGNPGDTGIVEMSDFLFTVKGDTKGAVLVQWNIHESTQGSVGMWDCHFRVGGATNSFLQLADCPPRTDGKTDPKCMAAALLLHLTPGSSGYFENVWAWTADHDIDHPIDPRSTDTKATMIEVYSARGILIESQGPTWLYGTASEHNALYQYQLLNAKNVWMGHIQSETPYYQPRVKASKPFMAGSFHGDPTWEHCKGQSDICEMAWGLRIINSSDVIIHGAGLYSFFNSYTLCAGDAPKVGGACQDRLFETVNSQNIYVYNLFTVGTREVASPKDGGKYTMNTNVQSGYSTEISAYLPLVANVKRVLRS